MKKAIAFLAAALLLAFSLGAGFAALDDKKEEDKNPNLLINGSFEEGPEPAAQGFTWLEDGAIDLPGWTVTRGQLSYIGTYWQHAEGKRSLDMHGGPGFGGIKQTIPTEKGKKYKVSFSLAGNPMGKVPKKLLGLSAAGKEEKFEFDCTGKTVQDMGWTTKEWEFVATGEETTLEFYTLMTECGECGPALDNITVKLIKK